MPSKNIPKDEIKSDSSSAASSIMIENNNYIDISSNSNESLSGLSNSSIPNDDDDDDDEADDHYNGADDANHSLLQIVPIVIPREPSLDQLLREVSGTQNLLYLTDVTLKVTATTMVGLQRLNDFMPNLRALTLDGSQLNTLRDLGFNLNLHYLNVSRCGLKTVDGVAGLLSVQHLIADQNHISQVSQLSNLPELKKLSLRGNKINDFATISFLVLCNELHEIDLEQNPICQPTTTTTIKHIEFRQMVKKLIPQLLILDGKTLSSSTSSTSIDDQDSRQDDPAILNNYSSEFNSSSLSSLTHSSESNGMNNNNNNNNNNSDSDGNFVPNQKRSQSSLDKRTTIHGNQLQLIKRPATADNHHQKLMNSNEILLSNGEPIFGNIIERIRSNKKKKNMQYKLAWNESSIFSSSRCSSSSSSSSLSFKSNTSNHHSYNTAATSSSVVDITGGAGNNSSKSSSSVVQLKISLNDLNKINENQFPKRLSQASIDLQFDNINLNGPPNSNRIITDNITANDDTINLLSIAKKWREAYRKTCENLKSQQSHQLSAL